MPKNQHTTARKARVSAREGEKFTTALRRLAAPREWEFSGEIFQWRGPSPYYFVAMPAAESAALKAVASDLTYYRGVIPIRVWIGATEWTTSLMPKDGRYLVPLRDSVRKPLDLADGDTVTVRVAVVERKRPAPRSDQAAPKPVRRTPRRTAPISADELRIVPANEATWSDLQAVFGERGATSQCWCQRYKMEPKESWGSVGAPALAERLREQTACGQPEAAATTGLVAYLDGDPVGWCAVDPRSANGRLRRNCRAPWDGRNEDKSDETVWAVTCFVTRAGFRRCGVSRALARAAVDFARQRGARALEGYPSSSQIEHCGTPGVFAAAGLVEVSRPSNNRSVMRIDFD